MEKKLTPAKNTGRNLRWWMRFLHNNTGFFIVGLVIIYSLSGIVQTYRDTNIFKKEEVKEMTLLPNLAAEQLGEALEQRNFKIDKEEGGIVYYKNGTYNKQTGFARYTTNELYGWIEPFTELHTSNSKGLAHYFTTALGALLFFMAISAFWMFKPGTKLFSRGIIMSVVGLVMAVVLLFL